MPETEQIDMLKIRQVALETAVKSVGRVAGIQGIDWMVGLINKQYYTPSKAGASVKQPADIVSGAKNVSVSAEKQKYAQGLAEDILKTTVMQHFQKIKVIPNVLIDVVAGQRDMVRAVSHQADQWRIMLSDGYFNPKKKASDRGVIGVETEIVMGIGQAFGQMIQAAYVRKAQQSGDALRHGGQKSEHLSSDSIVRAEELFTLFVGAVVAKQIGYDLKMVLPYCLNKVTPERYDSFQSDKNSLIEGVSGFCPQGAKNQIQFSQKSGCILVAPQRGEILSQMIARQRVR